MAVLVPDAAGPPVRLPLACDPQVQEANDDEALREYLDTGDFSSLVVPDGSSWVEVRPMTPGRSEAARASAGPVPIFGLQVFAEVGDGDGYEALDDAERAAYRDYRRWAHRTHLAVIREAVVRIEGWPTDRSVADVLADARATPQAAALVMELTRHAQRLSGLSSRGKGRSTSAPGSAGASSPADGRATAATESDDDSEETAEARSAEG